MDTKQRKVPVHQEHLDHSRTPLIPSDKTLRVLEGDPYDEEGDPVALISEWGDPVIDITSRWIGDPESDSGDPDFGDPEYGAPFRRIMKVAAGGRKVPRLMARSASKQSALRKIAVHQAKGLLLTDSVRFMQFKRCKYYNGPLVEPSAFFVDSLKYNLDKCTLETPYSQLTLSATGSGSVTLDASNAAFATQAGSGLKYIPMIILQIGSSVLNNIPNAKYTIEFKDALGAVASPLLYQDLPFVGNYAYDPSNPLVVTQSYKATGTIILFPFLKIKDRTLPTLFKLNVTAGVVTLGGFQVTVSGLPANSAVTMILPGGLSDSVNDLRTAIRKGIVL